MNNLFLFMGCFLMFTAGSALSNYSKAKERGELKEFWLSVIGLWIAGMGFLSTVNWEIV